MGYIRRGTTPTHTFTSSTDLSEATALYVTYQQGGKTVVEKSLEDIAVTTDSDTGSCTMTVELSQEETLAFDEKKQVEIQVRAAFANGTALASNIINSSPARLLKEGVI